MSGSVAWREHRPSSDWLAALDLAELWRYRQVSYFLALRDLKLRYRQTFFGIAWVIIQPLAAAAIFTIVFGRLTDLPSDGLPYVVFVYAALAVWTYTSTAVGAAAESLVENREMVTKIYFPRVLAPLGAVFPGLVDLAISLVVLGILMAITAVTPGVALLLSPLWLSAAVVVALAAGLWLSALNVQYRDVRYALTFLLQLWFFATPVVFPSSLFEGVARYVFSLNPMVGVIDGVRWSLVDGPAPVAADVVSLVSGLALLVGGIVYFRAVERRFADVI